MTQKLNYNVDDTNELLGFVDLNTNLAVLGSSTDTAIALDGLETPVSITNYTVNGFDGNIVEDPVLGTITVQETGIYKLVVYAGVNEATSAKDWGLQIYLDVNGTPIFLDSQWLPTDKTNHVSCNITATRQLTAGDVLTMQIASENNAVVVNIENSTFEVGRRL